ncbi:MAG: tRNA pseudouridine(55) synthase TruB, partial [Desulfobacterota bacterium]|nr:tRNA pseudouridine(55) synthase TruB [Thermodesulfobacteriota bacterium]
TYTTCRFKELNKKLNGIIIINKLPNITSFKVVKEFKKILRAQKAGHTGTLDPFAQGVLPIGINEGTKLVPFLMEEDKEYQAILRLGIETDTQDITGNIIREYPLRNLSPEEIGEVFKKFQGKIIQTPPMFSALKYKGVPLYQFARQGKEVERTPREVEIKEIEILKVELPRIWFRVICSKGTYIRTLASDLGKSLGSGACLEMLTRTRSGSFQIENSVTLEELKQTPWDKIESQFIIPLSLALPHFPEIIVRKEVEKKILRGKTVNWAEVKEIFSFSLVPKRKFKLLSEERSLIAIVELNDPVDKNRENSAWKILRMFNLT